MQILGQKATINKFNPTNQQTGPPRAREPLGPVHNSLFPPSAVFPAPTQTPHKTKLSDERGGFILGSPVPSWYV